MIMRMRTRTRTTSERDTAGFNVCSCKGSVVFNLHAPASSIPGIDQTPSTHPHTPVRRPSNSTFPKHVSFLHDGIFFSVALGIDGVFSHGSRLHSLHWDGVIASMHASTLWLFCHTVIYHSIQ
jgi:hypothetical protein